MSSNRLIIAIILAGLVSFHMSGCAVYNVARDERSVGKIVDDKIIASKIKYQLFRDDTVKGLDISVYVFLGKVFLVGAVENKAQKKKAVIISKNIEGVKSVKEYILSKDKMSLGKKVDDRAITAKVKVKMIKDTEMKSTQIYVKTILGHVVLLGIVEDKKDMTKAVNYARSVDNVTNVVNFIMLK